MAGVSGPQKDCVCCPLSAWIFFDIADLSTQAMQIDPLLSWTLIFYQNCGIYNQHGLNQWRASEFSFGVIAQESPSWAGRSSSRGSRSPEAETVCRDCLHILTAEAIKFWKFRTIRHLPDSWPDPVTVRLSDTMWGLAPVLAPPWD